MNRPDRSLEPYSRPTTQAAEGLPRWRWTLPEFERLIETGIIGEDDRVELIGGELVPMASKGIRHENVKADLELWLYRSLPHDLRVVTELGWRPDGETYCEPDLIVIPLTTRVVSKALPREVKLLIEVAETSLKYDTAVKAPLYAGLGVAEYWVVDATTLQTKVHLQPKDGAYASVSERRPGDALVPSLLPTLSLRLADLDLGDDADDNGGTGRNRDSGS